MTRLNDDLSTIRAQGSAQNGRNHWKAQRVSAVILAIVGLWFVVESLTFSTLSYAQMLLWIQLPWHFAGISLLLTAGCYHAYLGLCVIVEDYVRTYRMGIWLILTMLMVGVYSLGVAFLLKILGA